MIERSGRTDGDEGALRKYDPVLFKWDGYIEVILRILLSFN